MTKCAVIPTSKNFFQLYFVTKQFKEKLYFLDKLYLTQCDSLNKEFVKNDLFKKHISNINALCDYLCKNEKIEIVTSANDSFFCKSDEKYESMYELRSDGFRILTSNVKEDLVLILHDDIFYRNADFLKFLFSKVENGHFDIAGLYGEHSTIDFDLKGDVTGNSKTIAFASHNLVIPLNILKKTNGDFCAFRLKNNGVFPFINVRNTTGKDLTFEGFCLFSVQLYKLSNKIYFHDYDGYRCNNQIHYYNKQTLDLDFINISGGSGHLNYNLNPSSWVTFLKDAHFKLCEKNIAFSKIIMDKFPYELIEKFELKELYDSLMVSVEDNIKLLKSVYPEADIEKYYTIVEGYL